MRDYELMFIISPRVSEEETGGVIDRVHQYIANAKGEVAKTEPLGLRRLAYPIRDFREGFYVVVHFRMDPKATTELERNLKLTEDIIRHLLVRLGE
ncbi:MAG: 30S ribosomal protein S6 [Chloroflexota bacterium]